ncbi:MAG: SpoIID/LytB domain-containing protein [Clostridium sp.]
MVRKLTAFLISCVITMLCLPVGIVSANSISNPEVIKVGLKSIQSTSLSVKLEGHYKVNGVPMADKSLNFSLSGGKISFEGKTYTEVTLEPVVSSSKVAIVNGGKTCKYSGIIAMRVSDNKILPVNYIDMQSYLKGVLPHEISNSYPIEAIKAQAITSRTFALRNLKKHASEGVNVCDTTNCQVYKGEDPSYKNISTAVDQTKNMVVKSGSSLASVTFGASNGGYTESSLNIWGSYYDYLIVKEDTFDNNPWPENKVYTTAQIDSLLKSKGYLGSSDKFLSIGEIVRNSSARVAEMNIIYTNSSGRQASKLLIKEQPRSIFGLRSMSFDVSQSGDKYTFSGKGYGHGVGMSQLGAKARAEKGQNYSQIIGFYFPSTKIETLAVTEGGGPTLPPISPGPTDPSEPTNPGESGEKIIAQNGTRGSVVEKVQSNLNYLGYSAGSADGIFGKNTENAVKAFQRTEGLKETGIVYESTNTLIQKRVDDKKNQGSTNTDKIVAQKGTRSETVKQIQSDLNYLGFKAGTADGIFGSNTERAVKDFQKTVGQSQTGIVYESTYKLLKQKVSDKKSSSDSSNTVIAKKGSRGQEVLDIQALLNSKSHNAGKVDGIYGKNTEKAVESFQKESEISITGVVDNTTYNLLKK